MHKYRRPFLIAHLHSSLPNLRRLRAQLVWGFLTTATGSSSSIFYSSKWGLQSSLSWSPVPRQALMQSFKKLLTLSWYRASLGQSSRIEPTMMLKYIFTAPPKKHQETLQQLQEPFSGGTGFCISFHQSTNIVSPWIWWSSHHRCSYLPDGIILWWMYRMK